ncbi:unnamed protein product [Cylindrotheca closterium]|uniref:MORN repeat-containing protein 5 n=1 Tax=Cylindrotheca closterium TaxID=2856 RepID=A0AAD2PX82_9STRA|nr:unnamed protein product [Cylindrotheca closterium]
MSDNDSDDSSISGVKLNRLQTHDTGGESVFIPSDLPISNGMINYRPELQSTVSEISMGMDAATMSDPDSDGEEELAPKKGMHQRGGLLNMLPLEEELDLSDDDGDEDSDDDSDNDKDPNIPQDPYQSFQGKPVMLVTDQIVNDHYGDSGLYSGTVTADALVPHGKGLLLYQNSRIYDGEWEDGKWHGKGCWQNINGDVYNGSFRNEKRHGYGVYKWENGNEYAGEFKDDQRHGKGVFKFGNGTVYDGEFVEGVFEGTGTYSFGTGMYEGEWLAGKYHGKGFLLNANGSSYTGNFEAGHQHGEGVEFQADGTQMSGRWNRGRPPIRW